MALFLIPPSTTPKWLSRVVVGVRMGYCLLGIGDLLGRPAPSIHILVLVLVLHDTLDHKSCALSRAGISRVIFL
jgi:hypothetical protein